MSEPLVSVVVGVYNKERHVGECLRSVLAQTYPRFELIVVDDGSTDGSAAEIAQIQDARIRAVRRPANSGHPGKVRNQALRLAQGAYCAFLDADDAWLPEKLARQVAYMEAHPEFLFSHTGCRVIDADGKDLYVRHGGIYPPPGDCFADLVKHCFICTSTVMVRTELVGRVGDFSEEDCFRSGQDYEFFVRCAKATGIGILADPLARYRLHAGTVSRQSGNWRSIPRDFIRHRLFLRRRTLWEGKVDEADMRAIARAAAEENAFYWRQQGEFRKAAWFAWQMLRLEPAGVAGWRQLAAAGLRRT